MKTKTRKLLLFALVLAVLLPVGGYVGYRSYRYVRQVRLVKQAREYLAKSDPRKAMLCLRRALRYNPDDVEALRLMANLAEAGGSPGALLWRSRVVELNPHSLDDRLALAQSAILFRDYASATNALEGVDAAGKKTAAYHNIAGAVASTVNLRALAEAHFLEAARLEPTNPVPQLNLAIVRLHGTNALAISEARDSLTRISSNSNSVLRCQALRELVMDAMGHRQTNNALALSWDLVQQTNSTFSDRLLRLDVLKASQRAAFTPTLAAYQGEAGTNTAKIYELSQWQMTRIGPKDTLVWLQSLPGNLQTNQPVALLAAECQTALGYWRGLNGALTNQNWGELEFVRHAFMACALRGQDLSTGSKAEWELALKTANNQKAALVMLVRLAARWKWQSEAEEILWTIVNRYPDEKWAMQTLAQALFINGRTRPLMMLYTQELKRSPADLTIRNNVAMSALLLDATELKPHDLAQEVYEKAPTNAAFASTYAFSLHLQGKDAEALKIMQTLAPRQLEHPSIAGYYGLILKATKNGEEAKTYLDRAFKGPLLPEERKLFESARAGS